MINRDDEKLYSSVKNLIFSKAHSFARSTGHEVEELIAQGNLIYCQALKKHDPNKAKFITLLYLQLDQGLIQYTHKLSKHRALTTETKKTKPYIHPMPERSCHIRNEIKNLSEEGQHITRLILDNPEKLFKKDGLKPRQMYSTIKKYIKNTLQCPTIKTKQTMDEIKELAYCY